MAATREPSDRALKCVSADYGQIIGILAEIRALVIPGLDLECLLRLSSP